MGLKICFLWLCVEILHASASTPSSPSPRQASRLASLRIPCACPMNGRCRAVPRRPPCTPWGSPHQYFSEVVARTGASFLTQCIVARLRHADEFAKRLISSHLTSDDRHSSLFSGSHNHATDDQARNPRPVVPIRVAQSDQNATGRSCLSRLEHPVLGLCGLIESGVCKAIDRRPRESPVIPLSFCNLKPGSHAVLVRYVASPR